MKNRQDRLVVLNQSAQAVIETVRGAHPQYVFTYRGKPIKSINNTAWNRARQLASLNQVRVHDLKHTFGRRLRAAGVSFEDRQDLLGHRSSRITTHYSAAELHNLIAAANKACVLNEQAPSLLLLKKKTQKLAASMQSQPWKQGTNADKTEQQKVVQLEKLKNVTRKNHATVF